jgi:hypothetical protein
LALVCLPPKAVQALKAAAKTGEINIAKLYDMTSKERRELFAKHTDPALGKFVNTEFEKAMVSKQQSALTKWAEQTFTPSDKTKPAYKTVLDKINSLDEMGVLNPSNEKAFLEDLVSDRLGVSVTSDEVEKIAAKAQKIDDAYTKLGDNLLDVSKLDDNLAFFTAKSEMDKYLQELNPASNLKVMTGTVGRGAMLASVKSPVLNIGSNAEVGITEAVIRRIVGHTLAGGDNKLAMDYIKMAHTIYQKTGYDVTRMLDLSDGGVSGQRVLGDTVHAQGTGAVRQAGRIVEDTVFKQLMGAPDVLFGAAHFADSAGIHAKALAKGDPVLAKTYMADAMRLLPKTDDGKAIRSQAITDAQYATWTNKSWAAQTSLAIRKVLNNMSGDARLGDFLDPFVKTPANVIATGMDYNGLGLVIDLVRAVKAKELKDPAMIRVLARDATRSGLGLTAATVLAAQLKPADFIGAYDPARKQIEELKNSNTNAIKVGGKWISLDWAGPLQVPLTAQLYAKKYGASGSLGDKAVQYAAGVGSGIAKLPGLQTFSNIYTGARDANKQTGSGVAESTKNAALSEVYSRLVPSILTDIGKATDPFQREGTKGIDGIKAKTPYFRNHMPIKRDIFGDPLKNENPATTLLFGSRVKTDKSNKLTDELEDVGKANGTNVKFSDWKTSNAKAISQFRDKVGQQTFNKATIEYGQDMKQRLQDLFQSDDYKHADDQTKLALVNKQDADAQKQIFDNYGFKPQRTKSLLSK